MNLGVWCINYFLVFISILQNVNSARILVAIGTPAPSHHKPFQAVWKELSLRGHEVHVITPLPLKNKSLTNLTEYDVGDVVSYLPTIISNLDLKEHFLKKPNFLEVFLKDSKFAYVWTKMHEYELEHKNVKTLIKKNLKFDLVIVEWLFPTFASLGAYYKCPLVGMSSLGAPLVALDALGNPSHSLLTPDMNLPITRDMTLRERLMSFMYSVYVRLYYHLKVLPDNDKIVKRILGNDLPYLGDIERNISLLILNRNPVIHRPIPLLPNIIEVGRIQYSKEKQVLDKDLQNWLDNSKQGVIYFSFGGSFNTDLLEPKMIKILQDAFKTLPYNVLWKWNSDAMENQPGNVLIRKWLPQTAVLEHPNVKLFLYQGGLQSSEEAIAAHKPVIGIPTHSDQTANVDTLVKYGMGRMLDGEELTAKQLQDEILLVINDLSYANNAKNLDRLMSDQPREGLEKAIWWIEYVIRTKGAKHLRSVAVDLPLWQNLMLDIWGVVILVLLVIILVPFLILRGFLKLIFRRKKTKRD